MGAVGRGEAGERQAATRRYAHILSQATPDGHAARHPSKRSHTRGRPRHSRQEREGGRHAASVRRERRVRSTGEEAVTRRANGATLMGKNPMRRSVGRGGRGRGPIGGTRSSMGEVCTTGKERMRPNGSQRNLCPPPSGARCWTRHAFFHQKTACRRVMSTDCRSRMMLQL